VERAYPNLSGLCIDSLFANSQYAKMDYGGIFD